MKTNVSFFFSAEEESDESDDDAIDLLDLADDVAEDTPCKSFHSVFCCFFLIKMDFWKLRFILQIAETAAVKPEVPKEPQVAADAAADTATEVEADDDDDDVPFFG